MKTSHILGLGIGSVVLVLGLTWVITGNDFLLYKFFAPKQEQVRRETFEQTKSYNDGMIQELYSMQMDYVKSKDENQKSAMRAIILHRVAGYDQTKLPIDLRSFISSLKEGSK